MAPSPSLAIFFASSRPTSRMASSSSAAAALPGMTGPLPAAPFARTTKVSLVELSPSTVTWLKLRSAILLTTLAVQPLGTAASVVT